MSTALTGSGPQVVAQAIHSSKSEQLHNLGELVHANDGRVFRYCLNGGATMLAGRLQQRQAEITGDQNLTAVAAAIGDIEFVSTSTVTITANEYVNGWIMITKTPGQGRQYQIKGHAAFSGAAPTIDLIDPIEVALTTDSRVDLVHNSYSSVVIYPATATGGPVGVSVHPLVIAEYGWLAVGGTATCLVDTALTGPGLFVSAADGSITGAVDEVTHATEAPVGIALTGIADTEYGPIKLNLI